MSTVVIALGGNAISKRGEPVTVEVQRRNIQELCGPLADLYGKHNIVLTHGNGPQVGLLALQNMAYKDVPAFPLDVLGAQTQGMIGYIVELALRNALPQGTRLTTVLTNVVVDHNDPAYSNPTKFVGPGYPDNVAADVAERYGWAFKRDGEHMRWVVPSPKTQRVVHINSVRELLDAGHIVISTGGGGVPLIQHEDGTYEGTEAVVDKDDSSSVLAASLDADTFVMLTDAPAVCTKWGTPEAQEIRRITPDALEAMDFPAGSMGPKVDAAVNFVRRTGHEAAIGRIADLPQILEGSRGTRICPTVEGDVVYAPMTA